ncbi:MAG TPA: hypothetical protein VIV11_43470 [Kofleriaceae bacterium]
MWARIGGVVVVAFLALVALTAYRNVFADDAAVRAQAEKLARDKAGCGASCTVTRMEGSRGVLTETLTFTFGSSGTVTMKCRRAYIAFGAYTCSAS